jgi:hypothetical protein
MAKELLKSGERNTRKDYLKRGEYNTRKDEFLQLPKLPKENSQLF